MPAFRTLATVRHHAMVLTEHEFDVPLEHARPSGEQLTVFARAVRSIKKSATDLPWLVFLQGGPGFPGPRPLAKTGWLKRALDDYQVLLLDSRGNGRSSVVLPQTLARRAPDAFPELPMLADVRQLWSGLRTESQLRQSLQPAPANAGPLNSSALAHRAIASMRELSPGYLRHFLGYLDALSWMEQLQIEGAAAPVRKRNREKKAT